MATRKKVQEEVENPRMPRWPQVTFRDWVAAEVLKGFIVNRGLVTPTGNGLGHDITRQLAQASYLYADALLAERAVNPPKLEE